MLILDTMVINGNGPAAMGMGTVVLVLVAVVNDRLNPNPLMLAIPMEVNKQLTLVNKQLHF